MSEKRIPQPSRLARPTVVTGSHSAWSSTPPSSTSSSRTHSIEDLLASTSESFHVGDRVWVGGTKPGVISFIGETHFSTGEWAGVMLDSPVGKNDGSVAGRRYFSCEPNHGIFSHLSKLSRTSAESGIAALPAPILPEQDIDASLSATPALPTNGSRIPELNATASAVTPEQAASHNFAKPSVIPRRTSVGSHHSSQCGGSKATSPAGSVSEYIGGSGAGGTGDAVETGLSLPIAVKFKVGDRVKVSGSKCGTVRYVGPAEFARGIWTGIELDEPLGKNDGSVGSKRYFYCQPLHGLFAPLHKVTSLVGSFAPLRRGSLIGQYSAGLSGGHRASSQESISSLGSTSSASRLSGRMRLGVMSLSSSQGSKPRASGSSMTPTLTGLQKALKEKQEHIEQLLKERDMERSEFARTAAHFDEVDGQLASQKAEFSRFVREHEETTRRLKSTVDRLEAEKTDAHQQLLEEKRKVEDLQFTAEEAAIDRSDMEAQLEKSRRHLKELESRLKKEAEINERLSKELKSSCNSSILMSNDDYLDHIEELTHKLSVAENTIKNITQTELCQTCKTLIATKMSEKQEEGTAVAGEISRLKLQLQTALSERGVLEMRIGQMGEDMKRVEMEKNEAAKEKTDAATRHDKMAAERDRLIKERTSTQKQLRDTEQKLKEFHDMYEETKKTHTLQMTELGKRTMQLQQEADSLLKAQQILMPYKQQVDELTEQLKNLSTERDSLLRQFSQLNVSPAENSPQLSLTARIDELQARHSEVLRRVEAEKLAVESVNQSLQKDNEQLRNEVSILKRRQQQSTGTPTSQTGDQQQVQHLQQRISQLEASLNESQTNSNIITNGPVSESNNSKLLADKESAEAQIEFLNSVIIELQRKNEVLEAKLQVMESSGTLMTDSVTDSMIINGSVSRLIAPRLFCDICDVFDLHDTDDCPRQGMSSSPPASHHHGCRTEQRPYCNVCEVFGHATEQCGRNTIF